MREVCVKGVEEVLQHLATVNVCALIEKIVEKGIEVQEACWIVRRTILSLELSIIVFVLFDVYIDLLHVRLPVNRDIIQESNDDGPLEERQYSEVA